jgi:N-methylhydantoinase A
VSDIAIGLDVGGTFTDLVAVDDGELTTVKVPSTPNDPSVGAMTALDAAGLLPETVAHFAYGTTVGTNALLERRGARTALVTSEGFRDVIEIGRQNRPSLYDLTVDRPPSLVPRDLRITVRERMGPSGPVEALDGASVTSALEALRAAGVEAVAVGLLFGFLHPEHERVVGEAIRRAFPDVHVCLSSEVLPEFREFERLSTTVATAYIAPLLAEHLRTLSAGARERGIVAPLVMQSSGGVLDVATATTRAASCVLSGPAGGVVGAARVAQLSGFRELLTFDMGGTSTDVAPILDGAIQSTTDSVVAGVPIRFPMVDVHTVSAGGGSIAWVDAGGALRVGPRSAGAVPGPAAYANGGTDPTVTDADLLLGYLRDGARLGGQVVLRRELAEEAIRGLADALGLDTVRAAEGVLEVAHAEMTRALRVVSVHRGFDPREFALVAFGGAGPMHACALAEELGILTILVPRVGGVLSALGLAISDARSDYVAPILTPIDDLDLRDLSESLSGMEAQAMRDLPAPRFRPMADLRYAGQSFELTVDVERDGTGLAEAFHRAHERRHGYRMQDAPVEIVNARLVATAATATPQIPDEPPRATPEPEIRTAWFDGAWLRVPVLDRGRLGSGGRVEGPAIVEFPEATCVVRPGWRGEVDRVGSLVLRRG